MIFESKVLLFHLVLFLCASTWLYSKVLKGCLCITWAGIDHLCKVVGHLKTACFEFVEMGVEQVRYFGGSGLYSLSLCNL